MTTDNNIPYQTDEISSLKTAFEGLTPGRQRAYILYFSAPKQSKTRESRVEKYIQQILKGKGLHDWQISVKIGLEYLSSKLNKKYIS